MLLIQLPNNFNVRVHHSFKCMTTSFLSMHSNEAANDGTGTTSTRACFSASNFFVCDYFTGTTLRPHLQRWIRNAIILQGTY